MYYDNNVSLYLYIYKIRVHSYAISAQPTLMNTMTTAA